SSVSDIRSELCRTVAVPTCSQRDRCSLVDVPTLKDVEFIQPEFCTVAHRKRRPPCDGVAKVQGANEADRRHEWDALLLNFFEPVLGQRDVLLERQLNVTRTLLQ
ncbi:hypothetical protein EDB19DRAFT_1864303, partial [Suillus lakei]